MHFDLGNKSSKKYSEIGSREFLKDYFSIAKTVKTEL